MSVSFCTKIFLGSLLTLLHNSDDLQFRDCIVTVCGLLELKDILAL